MLLSVPAFDRDTSSSAGKTDPDTALFTVSGINKKYRSHTVLKNLSFTAAPGDCIGLIGPNGCGKSTLLQILSGIQKPDSGDILYNGVSLFRRHAFEDLIGYVPQNNALFEDMTVLDHLKLWYSDAPLSLSEALDHGFASRLGLSDFLNRPVKALSGGMKKRVSLACSLAKEPPVILLDEPAASLDLLYKDEIRSFIEDLKKQNKIVLLATHEEADFPICTRLMLFSDGSFHEYPSDISTQEILSHMKESSKS